jgi:transcription-repair coupling factor (superfamily II helicase)
MLRVRAAREHMPGIRYPGDTTWQREFEASSRTRRPRTSSPRSARSRRTCRANARWTACSAATSGFGKTEVAIRAAFKACEFGKQVAVLVPTTVLAEQHERTFRQRFADYPFRVESLSRFKTTKEINATLARCARGRST